MAARQHSHIPSQAESSKGTDGSLATFSIDGRSFSVQPCPQSDGTKQLRSLQSVIGHLSVEDRDYMIVQIEQQKVPGAQSSFGYALSKRELQIVVLVAEGKVNKQIADSLKISEWTVSTYLRRIFAKLGVDSRAAMVFKCSKFLHHDKCET